MSYSSTILGTTGLVSYYKLDETSGTTLHDSNSSNHGTLTGSGVSFNQAGPVTGIPSIKFNTDFANIADASNLHLSTISVEAWIKYLTVTGDIGETQIILDKTTSSGGIGFRFGMYCPAPTQGNIDFYNGHLPRLGTADNTEGNGSWHHIVATHNGSVSKLYLDGILVTTSASDSSANTNSTDILMLGKGWNGSAYSIFPGLISNVAIYNTVLSGTDISAHYSAMTPPSGSSGDLFPRELFNFHLFPEELFPKGSTGAPPSLEPHLTQILSLDQTVTSNKRNVISYGITNFFGFTQNITTIKIDRLNRTLLDTLVFTDIVRSNHIPLRSDIVFTDFLKAGKIYHRSLTDNIVFTTSLLKTKFKFNSFTQTLSFTQDLDFWKPVNAPINPSVLHFTQSLGLKRRINQRLIDILVFTDSLNKTNRFTFSLSSVLLFTGGGGYSSEAPEIKKTFEGYTFIYQDSIAIKIHRYIVLKSDTANIVLPAPLFGDTQNNLGTIAINRQVTGKIFTYVKTTQRQKLNYKFELKRQKAHELQIFLDQNDLKWLDLENWKGELWKVRITNNPVIFEATSRGYSCVNNWEVHQVSLQFEGYRLSASATGC